MASQLTKVQVETTTGEYASSSHVRGILGLSLSITSAFDLQMKSAGFVAFVWYDFAFSGTRILGLLEQIVNTHAISIGWLCCETCEEYMQGGHASIPGSGCKLRLFFFSKKSRLAADPKLIRI